MDQWFEQHFLHGEKYLNVFLSTTTPDLQQFATLICVFTLDRIGRRWTLYWGSVAQGIAMFLAGGFSRLGINATAAGDTATAAQYGAAAASMVFIFTSVFGATWLTVPWLYPAEIFPLAVRARGNAWGVVGWSIGNGWLVSRYPLRIKKSEKVGIKELNTTTNRPFSVPSCSAALARKLCTFSASPMSSPSRWFGRCTQRATSARSKIWISCSRRTLRGIGMQKARLLDSRLRTRTWSRVVAARIVRSIPRQESQHQGS